MAAIKNLKGKKILIVEDEPALRDIYATKLESEGCVVIQASDGTQGFNAAIQQLPDVILLDVIMPVKDGFEVLKDLKLNPKTQQIPVIFLSNLGQSYEIKRGLDLGAEDFLTKANLVPSKIVEKLMGILNKKTSK
ncbi:MAG: response regulator [Patescibacteria group bacterium]